MADLQNKTFAETYPKLLQDPGDGTIQKSDGTAGATGKADLTGGNTFSGVQNFTDRIDANAGISFDGGSNVLGDYDNSINWTPVHEITYTTNPAVGGGTSPSFSGSGIQIGDLYFLSFVLDFDDSTTPAVGDRWRMSGLPDLPNYGLISAVGEFIIYDSISTARYATGTVGIDGSLGAFFIVNEVSGSFTYESTLRGTMNFKV